MLLVTMAQNPRRLLGKLRANAPARIPMPPGPPRPPRKKLALLRSVLCSDPHLCPSTSELLHGRLCCTSSPSCRVISCLYTCVNLARTLLLICFVTRRATRSLDPVAPRVTPVAAPRAVPAAAPAVPPTASDTSTTPLVRKRAADAATLKAERAKRQKAAADARQVRPNAPAPSSIDLDADSPIPTAEPLLIDPSGVAHSNVPTADLVEEQRTPPVASPARVTVAVPAPATRSVEPSADATDQATYVFPLLSFGPTPFLFRRPLLPSCPSRWPVRSLEWTGSDS